MANKNKSTKIQSLTVQSIKNMPSDQITEFLELLLVELVKNSKMKDTLKNILIEIIQEIENQVNPDGTLNSVPVTGKKKWWKTVLGYIPTVFFFVLKFVGKKK